MAEKEGKEVNTVYQFAKEAVKRFKDFLPPEYQDVEIGAGSKEGNNGTYRSKFYFMKPGEGIPVWMDIWPFFELYHRTGSLESAMKELVSAAVDGIKAARKTPVDDMGCFENMKNYLEPVLINTKANLQMLQDIPHKKLEDLSLICQVRMPVDGDYARMNVTDRELRQWGIGKEELFGQMIENTRKPGKWILQEMDPCISELTGMEMQQTNLLEIPDDSLKEMETGSVRMYVLSNMDRENGAAAVVCQHVMEKAEKVIPEGFYILPSSIHECILFPKVGGFDPEQLREIVCEINITQLNREDILSNNVYEYDKEHGKIRQADRHVERERRWIVETR